MSKRFGVMTSRSERLDGVPGTTIYCTLIDAFRVAEYVRVEQGLHDVAVYDYEEMKFI